MYARGILAVVSFVLFVYSCIHGHSPGYIASLRAEGSVSLTALVELCATSSPAEIEAAWGVELAPSLASPCFFRGCNGAFTTRRRYSQLMAAHKSCSLAAAARLPAAVSMDGSDTCALAAALSAARAAIRLAARAEGHLFARRLSHALECGTPWPWPSPTGWLVDCAPIPEHFYFEKYAPKFAAQCDRAAALGGTCEPLCRLLIDKAATASDRVDRLFSVESEALSRTYGFGGAALLVAALAAHWLYTCVGTEVVNKANKAE